MSSALSKGARLGQLLDEAEKIGDEMNNLFLKNGLPPLELKKLPEADRNEWYRLLAVKDKLTSKMCDVISGKSEKEAQS